MDVTYEPASRACPRRIGVLGGTFDPIHLGHLVIAEEARCRLSLDRVLFVPAQVSPLKVDSDPVSAEHRARMVELAIAGNPAFALSRVDLDRPGPSYTVDTLRLLKAEYGPETELFFIVGEDSLETFMRWRSPGEILQLSRLVVVSRPGYDVDLNRLQARLPELSAALVLADTPEIMISSTEVRRRVREGWTIRYLVPEPVERYVREHDLYLNGGSDPPGDERLGERHGFRQRAG